MARKPYVYLIGTGLIVLLFLSGCKSAQLKTLENAAAVIQITTGHEVRRFTHNEGTSLGKPVYAKVLIVYEPIGNYAIKDVYGEIVAVLKNNGWQGNEPLANEDYFKATLQQGRFEISTGVATDENKNIVTVTLIIY